MAKGQLMSGTYAVDPASLGAMLEASARIGGTNKGGLRRLALTREDKAARDQLADWARPGGWGLEVDGLGNMFVRREGSEPALAPVLVGKRLESLAVPLDLGASLGGVRIFGDHKTVRGLVVGVLAGAAAFLCQRAAGETALVQQLALVSYDELPRLTGAWLGFGAIAGDAVKSFFKRRVGIAPGKPWQNGTDESFNGPRCFVLNSAGVKYPRLECGRTSL